MKNVIIAYSLNPEIIVKEFEQKTPTLKKRINCINYLQKLGWHVGLRFDPLINYSKNKLTYKNFFASLPQLLVTSTTCLLYFVFDFLLIDHEHGYGDPRGITRQVQSLKATECSALVRIEY